MIDFKNHHLYKKREESDRQKVSLNDDVAKYNENIELIKKSLPQIVDQIEEVSPANHLWVRVDGLKWPAWPICQREHRHRDDLDLCYWLCLLEDQRVVLVTTSDVYHRNSYLKKEPQLIRFIAIIPASNSDFSPLDFQDHEVDDYDLAGLLEDKQSRLKPNVVELLANSIKELLENPAEYKLWKVKTT